MIWQCLPSHQGLEKSYCVTGELRESTPWKHAANRHNRKQVCLSSLSPGSPSSSLQGLVCATPSALLLRSPADVEAHLPPFSQGKLLSELCTWGVGGPAELFCEVHDELQLASALRYCAERDIHFLVIGKGSNCLFDDRGFNGCIILNQICFLKKIAFGVYHVGSGYPYNALGTQSSKDGFTGLEFAAGIPGTVGGAVFMNAGADGHETAGVLKSVEIVATAGSKHVFERKELTYSYRSSPFQALKCEMAISAATFDLLPCPDSKKRQRDYLDRRKKTQPVAERTAGCVFRNPRAGSQSAGSLIDQAGLKGVSIGGAKVSEVHANFLVNTGGCQSAHILELISLVREKVRLKFGIDLVEEIVYIPPSKLSCR